MRANTPTNSKRDEGPLTVKEYLESAAQASRRTRFITIAMTVASVLLLVSVLNSWDLGWISLRINALERKQLYAVRKFPLLCACPGVNQKDCAALKPDEIAHAHDTMFEIRDLRAVSGDPKKVEAANARLRQICEEETKRLNTFSDALVKTSAETKYTIRVPFFGAAFDINDVGILAGLALIVVLVLLRLSLRSLILSLRIGFKKAFDSNEEADFYDVLATQQVFTFPPLEDKRQEVVKMQGWIERSWRRLRSRPLKDEWTANRTKTLRFIPHFLSLLPTVVYGLQFANDWSSMHYALELHWWRAVIFQVLDGILLIVIFVFGLWCITKWNEMNKIWDYFDDMVKNGKKLVHREKNQDYLELCGAICQTVDSIDTAKRTKGH